VVLYGPLVLENITHWKINFLFGKYRGFLEIFMGSLDGEQH